MEPKVPDADCENCPLSNEPFVPSYGPSKARLAVCGEAPGREEARLGKPFLGSSGKLLKEVLRQSGIDPDEVFYTNACLCRPKDNRTPTKQEIKCCSKRLERELKEHDVSQILALGNTANTSVFGKAQPITTLRAGPPKVAERFPGVEIVPSLHPAACLRNGDSFPSLVADVQKLNQTVRIKWEPPQYKVFDEPNDALTAIALLHKYSDRLVVDIETAHDKDTAFEHPSHYELLCIGIGYQPGKVAIFERGALASEGVKKQLAKLLEVGRVTAHNGKFDIQGMRSFAPDCRLYFDTMLASYSVDERGGVHSLGYLGQEVLGTPNWKNAMKKWPNYGDAPVDVLDQYNAYDVSVEWDLQDYYEANMDSDARRVHDRLVRTSNALVPVELDGLAVDIPYLDVLEVEWQGKLANLTDKILPLMVEPISKSKKVPPKNPNSVPQVTRTLERLGVKKVESTDAEHLQAYAEKAKGELKEFLALMLEYRKEQKVYGTYIAGARKRLYDGRLYPTFLLHGTTSGRPSCRNPNLFNIPRGSSIRQMFVPRSGKVFVYCDYSQIEWRVVATLAQEPFLRDIFKDPTRDIHSEVAARIGSDRDMAKKVAHASNYGMGIPHLANLLGISINQAGKLMRDFFRTTPHVVAWQQDMKRKLFIEHDDLVTPYGRHRRFYLITDENRHDVYKEALSFEPQSIASDICMTAMVNMLERGMKAQLSVYDSIMVECDESDAEDVGREMQRIMLEAGEEFTDYVPFTTDMKIGRSWGELS